jgi:hypothetical protein
MAPSFNTLPPRQPSIPPGVYVAKVIAAKEKISEASNDMLVMKLMIPDGRTIGSVLTFVPAAQPVINAFCDSADLPKPTDPDVAVDLNANHCFGRYLYIIAETDNQAGTQPKVTRFLTRAEALAVNPGTNQAHAQRTDAFGASPHETSSVYLLKRNSPD